ncbi:MAG: TolC family protein [Deltaproteobacteria bacterium]|nr:TolC family protein [Deltaproteobacteria bacterium]
MFKSKSVYQYCAILFAFFLISCSHGLPELDPYKKASPTSGEEWEPTEKEREKAFELEELPTIPEELEPDADNLTLSQLVDIALANNPTTQIAWEDARASAAAWAESRGLYYPQISGFAGYFYAQDGGSSVGGDAFNEQYGDIGLSLNYLLLDFGGREAQIDAARLALLNANWNQNQAIQDVLRDVADIFYKYIGSKALVLADETNLQEAQTSLEAADLRLEAGVGTLPDVLQARATLAQVQLDLVENIGDVEINRGLLASAVGWPSNTKFDVSGQVDELPLEALSENVDDLIEIAMQNRPALAAVQASVREKEAELREAKSDFFPEISATGQVSRFWVRPDGQTSEFFTNYLLGVQLQVPIFQGFTLINAVRQANAELQSARAALRLQEQIVIDEVWNSYYKFRTAVQSLEAADVLLESSIESYDASLARYRSGVGDIIELLNAQTTLAEGRAEQVQATTDIFTSYANLINAMGTDIPSPVEIVIEEEVIIDSEGAGEELMNEDNEY